MLVMGHIGLTPQSSGQLSGFKAQGRTADTAMALVEDARAIQVAGVFALLVEAVPPGVCKIMRDELTIPVYSIGAVAEADGQLMIVSDMLGVFKAFKPKFVRQYADLAERILTAFNAYINDVKAGAFPEPKHTYKMVDGGLPKLLAQIGKSNSSRIWPS
jgi:3-methyl-2-oxobutanoate hydroxymethyltransferase